MCQLVTISKGRSPPAPRVRRRFDRGENGTTRATSPGRAGISVGSVV
jgi:hypothetical protein